MLNKINLHVLTNLSSRNQGITYTYTDTKYIIIVFRILYVFAYIILK